jgi:hypothetical protein
MLFGVLIYGYLFGYATLNPANVAWMMQGDPAQHYLGWQFFRCEPWQWPLGRINSYGYPAGTTIVFSDAIPLLALAFKPFNALLGSEFQYFGLWILSCYLLTGLFAQRLMGWFTPHPWLRMLGACLFILSPPMLMRGYGHEALMAHWLLLAAMHGFLAAWSPRKWLLLLVTAALTIPTCSSWFWGYGLPASPPGSNRCAPVPGKQAANKSCSSCRRSFSSCSPQAISNQVAGESPVKVTAFSP